MLQCEKTPANCFHPRKTLRNSVIVLLIWEAMRITYSFSQMRISSRWISSWTSRTIEMLVSVRTSPRSASCLQASNRPPWWCLASWPQMGEKMPSVRFETGYWLTAADYRVILAKKVLLWVRKITKNADYVFFSRMVPQHTKHEFLLEGLLVATVTRPQPSGLQRVGRILKTKLAKFAITMSKSWSPPLTAHGPGWGKATSI